MEQQRAAEAAGHEYLEDDERVDGVSKINEEHFEMATSESRRSMSVAQARHHPGRDRRAGDGGGENLYAQKVAWRETAGGRREREMKRRLKIGVYSWGEDH